MANIRAQQQYSLRWNNYLRHITFAFDDLKSNGDLVDVTLCCDGQKIKAHKVLLSACSAYFKEIFKDNPHPHPVIVFKFIKFEDLNAIIQFIYQGEVNVQQDALQSFLQTAELLAIQGLTTEDKTPKDTNENKITKILPSTIQTIQGDNINTGIIGGATTTTTYTIDHQQPISTLAVKRRKSSTNTTKQNVQAAFAECITFTKDDVKGTTEMQFIPTTVKVDIPELIHVPDINQQIVNEQETQTIDKITVKTDNHHHEFTTTDYEILEDSQIIEDKLQNEQNIQMSLDPNDEVAISAFTTQSAAQTDSDTLEQNKNSTNIGGSAGSVNKWTECSYCKMTITTVNLWRHIRTQHTPEPPKICEICSKHFKNKYSLREHIRITHETKNK